MKRFAVAVLLAAVLVSAADIAEAYFRQGVAGRNSGDLEQARAALDKAVKLEPTVAVYRFTLGTVLARQEDYHGALHQLKKAVDLDARFSDAYYLIEDYYARLDRIDEAVAYLQNELTKYPDRFQAIVALGHAYYRLQDYTRARIEFSRAQVEMPNDPTLNCAQGIVSLALGEDDAAEASFTDALTVDDQYAEAHLYYSLVLEKKGRNEQAAKERETAYSLKPSLRDVDLSGALPLRGEKADIPFILSTLDIIIEKLVRPEERRAIMEERKPFDLNLGLGFAKIGEDPWLALSSAPEMDRDWAGFKLALGLYFNQDGEVRTREFDYQKILQSVRLGHPNLPVHAGFGLVRDYTLGYGLILRNYFNQSDENNLDLGGLFTLQNPANTIGLTGMVSDVPGFADSAVMAGHAFVGRWAPQPEDVFQRFELGVTMARDAGQGLSAMAGDGLVYLASRGTFNFLAVGEFGKITGHGSGTMAGVLMHFGGLAARDVSFSLFGAGLFLGDDFVPAPFDAFYEQNRRQYAAGFEDSLFAGYDGSATGLYGMTGLNLAGALRLTVDYQSVSGIPSSGLFSARITAGESVPYLRLQGFFYKQRFDEIGDITTMDRNTYLAGLVGIKLVPNLLSLNFIYEQTYVWEDGRYEAQKKVSPYIQFGARF